MKPVILDAFCGAGGSARGYQQAGCYVVGIDENQQPRYAGDEFIRGDALEYLADRSFMRRFDGATGSPPCQSETDLRHRTGKTYPDLLTPTLALLRAQGLPWVVENVEGSVKMPGSLVLCGTEFGLKAGGRYLKRHRRFLASFDLWGAGGCSCRRARTGGVYGTGGGGEYNGRFKFDLQGSRVAMGIDWMDRREISQAIPPAYTRFIGEQLVAHLRERVA